jgi:hypothetical protein
MENLDIKSVLNRRGGQMAISKALCVPYATVASWKKNGIPEWRMAQIKIAAENAGLDFLWLNLPRGAGAMRKARRWNSLEELAAAKGIDLTPKEKED